MTQESACGQVTIIMQKCRHIPTPLSVQVCIEVLTLHLQDKVLKLVFIIKVLSYLLCIQ